MKNFPPLRWFFVILGFVQVRYEPKVDKFKIDPFLTAYAVLVSFVIQSYRTYSLVTPFVIVAEAEYLAQTKHVWIGNLLIYIDFVILYILNTCTIGLILMKMRRHSKLLNSLIQFQKEYNCLSEINTNTKDNKGLLPFIWTLILLTISCPAITVYVFINA